MGSSGVLQKEEKITTITQEMVSCPIICKTYENAKKVRQFIKTEWIIEELNIDERKDNCEN